MRCYRAYLIGQKRVWMAGGAGHRCLRGLIRYRPLVEEYLAAKRYALKIAALGQPQRRPAVARPRSPAG
jgi:hypothetical protein